VASRRTVMKYEATPIGLAASGRQAASGCRHRPTASGSGQAVVVHDQRVEVRVTEARDSCWSAAGVRKEQVCGVRDRRRSGRRRRTVL
jgi:hypothetical protein